MLCNVTKEVMLCNVILSYVTSYYVLCVVMTQHNTIYPTLPSFNHTQRDTWEVKESDEINKGNSQG